MALSMGIVGLPNVGKSTTFNALTKTQNAQVANYPFCTIQPNKAIVPLVDPRVDTLVELAQVPQAIYATIEFVDIAGLVKGASRGEGLGNQFLGHIRDTDAIVHVVRCFDDENVVHVGAQEGSFDPQIDPREDIETINLELILADLQQVDRKIEPLTRQVKGDKGLRPTLELAQALQNHLNAGRPIMLFPDQDNDTFRHFNQEMRFLTAKPVIYAANVDEAGLAEDNDYVRVVRQVAAAHGVDVVKLCARLEAEMADTPEGTRLTDAERREFLQLAGAAESGLEQIVRQSFKVLGLITYFTMNENEVRAWTIQQGWTAPRAARVIHTDFERGFIRAEVIPYAVYVQHGSSAAAKAAGAMRLEGKDYVVQDGDVLYFRFQA